MEVKDLKWYSPFVFLVGAILSFADPITDIITLVEFYRNDHKTWFGVGLAFVILPCFVYLILFGVRDSPRLDEEHATITGCCARAIICGLHPFSAALARLKGFAFSLKKWRRGDDETDAGEIEKGKDLFFYIYLIALFESALESAPQFIIQLYAMNAQEEPVHIIQMISLPVSFLSLNWAFVNFDGVIWFDGRKCGDLTIGRKILIFVTHFFLLSSRLFAVCYFTVAFKWWVIGVLLLHTFMMMMPRTILCCSTAAWDYVDVILEIFFLGVHWLRDDLAVMKENPKNKDDVSVMGSVSSEKAARIVPFLNILTVIENLVMILMFYFSQHSNSWFSLPVTVCVCSFSVIGSIMRIAGLYYFLRPRTRE